MTTAAPAPLALTPAQAASVLGVSKSTLHALLRRDAGLRRCRRYLTSRCVRYDAARLAAWVSKRPDAPAVAS